jgi:hypothetical protein
MKKITIELNYDGVEDYRDMEEFVCDALTDQMRSDILAACKIETVDEVERAKPDTVPDYVAQLFTLSEKMLVAGDHMTGWAVEVRVIANCLTEGLNLDQRVGN